MTAGLVLFAELLKSMAPAASAAIGPVEDLGKAAEASAADIAKMNGALGDVDEMKALIVVDVHRSTGGESPSRLGNIGGFRATNPAPAERPGSGTSAAARSPRISPELQRILDAAGGGGLEGEALAYIETFMRNEALLARADLNQQTRQIASLFRQELTNIFNSAFGRNLEALARELAALQRGRSSAPASTSRPTSRPTASGTISLGIIHAAGGLP